MIDVASLSDVNQLMDMLVDFHAESPAYSQKTAADRAHTQRYLEMFIREEEYNVLVVRDGDKITGLIIFNVGPSWNTPTIEACEMILYVRPEYRKGRAAFQLISCMTTFAKAKGAVRIHAGASTGKHHESISRLYQRHGYIPADAVGVTKEL